MKYRRLGKTNLKVSEIGMGTWQITDDEDWGKGPHEQDSFINLQRFIDLGGNHIDTAWIYGYRAEKPDKHPSEELIGKFLTNTKQREKVIITTKIPPINFAWPAPIGATMATTFPKSHILKCVDDSLRSLQTDHIDVMIFHVWRDEFNQEDEWKEICTRLTNEGKVRFWGLSPNYYQPDGCLKTIKEGIVSVVQCIFNIFHQKPIAKLFPTAQKYDVGIVACVPFDEGGLTGSIDENTIFNEGDFRIKYFAGSRLTELVQRTTKLKELLGDETKTLPELALRFILSFVAISSVIPGMRKLKNIDVNTAVSDGRKLSQVLLNELQNHSWERNFYPWAA